jgi:hypothetical protein
MGVKENEGLTTNRVIRELFPTPLSPNNKILKKWSQSVSTMTIPKLFQSKHGAVDDIWLWIFPFKTKAFFPLFSILAPIISLNFSHRIPSMKPNSKHTNRAEYCTGISFPLLPTSLCLLFVCGC